MTIFYHCTFYSIEFLIRPKFLVIISWKSLFFLVHILTYRHILTILTYYPTSSDKKRGFHFYAPDAWHYAACLVACPCFILGCDCHPTSRSLGHRCVPRSSQPPNCTYADEHSHHSSVQPPFSHKEKKIQFKLQR